MKSAVIFRVLLSLSLSMVALSAALALAEQGAQPKQGAQDKDQPKQLTEQELYLAHLKAKKAPTGPSFYIGPMVETPGWFSVLLSAGGTDFATEMFKTTQLEVFEAIMLEAKAFAETEEAVGTTKPIITRFYNKKQPAMLVDVAKVAKQSRFYVTLKGLTRTVTIDAGGIRRGEKKEEATPLFFDILSRIQAARSAEATQK